MRDVAITGGFDILWEARRRDWRASRSTRANTALKALA